MSEDAGTAAGGLLGVLRLVGREVLGFDVTDVDVAAFGRAGRFATADTVLGLVVREAAAVVLADDRDLADALDRPELAAAGLAADMVLAAALSAFAAVVIDLVAVFIARIAADMVLADAVALVAAAVIFVAADVTLVAAVDTVRAAVAGVAVPRPADPRLDRDVLDLDAIERDAVRLADLDALTRLGLADVVRVLLGLVPAARALAMVFGRLAVPPDALRLVALLRTVVVGLRRVAAWVVDSLGTELPPS